MTHFVCPHCGQMAATSLDVYAIDFANGCPPSYFPVADREKDRERHIDTRVCCDRCWDRHGKVAKAVGRPHPFSGTAHAARREAAVGQVIGAPVVHKE